MSFALVVPGINHAQTEKTSPVLDLQKSVDRAAAVALKDFGDAGLKSNQLAITLIDLSRGGQPLQASYRGEVPIYPASVIKMFYLAAAHHWMEDGKMQDTAELRRAMKDMIVESYNEATHYIVDQLTGTTSGPELPAEEMAAWKQKRNAVNRYFESLGYTNINANQKPWCEGPYGRERVFVGAKYDNRNMLTTDATARLLSDIAQSRAITPARSQEMMALMARDPFAKTAEPSQANAYTGLALPAGSKLWSKAGWTSAVRHDAAYVELPTGQRFVLVTFTSGHSEQRDIIPTVARAVIADMAGLGSNQ